MSLADAGGSGARNAMVGLGSCQSSGDSGGERALLLLVTVLLGKEDGPVRNAGSSSKNTIGIE